MNTVSVWKRSLAIFLAALMIVGMIPLSEMLASDTYAASGTRTIYFVPSDWASDSNAWFQAWVWDANNNGQWVDISDSDKDGTYEMIVPSNATGMKLLRKGPGHASGTWDKWNETGDISIGTNNCFTINGWSYGSWSTVKYTVVGDKGLTGENWNTASSANILTDNGDGTCSITYKNIPSGNYGFKVIKDGAYSNGEWGKNGQNYPVSISETSNVTITFNVSTKSITVKLEKVQSTTTYNVTFNGTNVTSNGVGTATGGSAYTATLSAVSGYTLPSTITVKRGSTTLTAGTDYSYSSSTGKLTINASAVTGNISITAVGEAEQPSGGSTHWSIYLKTNANWETANAWFAVYYWTDSSSGWASMQSTGETYIYHALIPAEAKVIFARMNPASTALDWNNKWNQTGNLTPTGDSYMYTLPSTVSDGTTDNKWSEYTGSFVPPEPPVQKEDFMVNTTIVDYLNDFRVDAGPVNGYSDKNQGLTNGECDWSADGTPTFTLLNYYISSLNSSAARSSSSGQKVYFKPSSDWKNGSAVFAVYYWYGTTNGWVRLTETSTAGIFEATVPSSATDVLFARMASSVTTISFDTIWNQTADQKLPGDGYLFTVNDGAVYDNHAGTWTQYASSGSTGSTTSTSKYYPLYFGNLYQLGNRFGTKYTNFTDYNAGNLKSTLYASGKTQLSNWYSAANVALEDFNAVVQGLVHNKLLDANGNVSPNGNMYAPDGTSPLIYFNKDMISAAKNGGKSLIAYYDNLKFPMHATYDPSTRVTTYSYDSASDDAVFLNYTTNELYTSTNYAKDNYGAKGFYPLNQPGDSGDAANQGFGVKFTLDFTISDDGVIRDAEGKETNVQFKFTGDDDVWVFIDGYLVLDLGGAHKMATGIIDFADLEAIVYKQASIEGATSDINAHRDTLSVTAEAHQGFPSDLANKIRGEYEANVSQVHTLTMFYMERGGFESNMSIQFSMTPVPTGLTISKDIENVNPGLNAAVQDDDEFEFSIEATDKDGKDVTFDSYDLTDHGNITTGMTSTNGIITGVRGDQFAQNFTMNNLDAFTAGTSFKVTELDVGSKYLSTRWVVYEYRNGYTKIAEGEKTTVAEFSTNANSSGNYALNFVNSLKSGTLTVSKSYMDTLIDHSDMAFSFKINLDLDGEGYKLYPGLTYDLYSGTSLIAEDMVSEDGTINLKAGQVAKIKGIPVGTKYQVVEVDNSDRWELSSSSGTKGTMTVDGATASFVNMTSTNPLAGSVIYVEAGSNTEYNIADVTLSGVNSDTAGLVKIENGKLIVNAPEAGKVYAFTYVGVHSDGRYVSGVVTVYSYKAMDKTYVFDFGLSSVISNTTTGGHGLFQGGTFIIVDDNATSTLTITGGGTQTTITASGSFDESDPSKVPTVTFTPVAFMSQVEEYTYTVTITANGKTFKANDPETGCTVTGTIKVMPANTVYYEDNFNVKDADNKPTQEIIFNQGNSSVALTAPSSNPTLAQSNDQSTNYGKDDCYKNSSSYDAYGESNGASTTLAHLQYAYFTFSGTGFDLISETKADSAGMAVYVFAGGFDQAHLDYVTNHSNTSQTPADLVFVNNYYANGSLYQVPVASVRLSTQSTYTVYVQALSTMHGDSVTIDGVRIYNPLTNTDGYKSNEKGVQIDELRVLYKNEYVGLAGKGTNNSLFVGLGRQSVVQGAMANASILEDPNGKVICTAADLENIYLHGPNNELYLPYNFGINLSYTVNSADWTLQIGAKAVTEKNEAKSFTVYVKNANGTYTDANSFVVDVTSTTDMYYDLTEKLTEKGFGNEGSYEIIILSNSAYENNEFVSLTTVKHKGIEIKK